MDRRILLTAVIGLSAVGFIAAISACAEAPPMEELIGVQEPTEPEAGTGEPIPLPPSNPPPPADAGADTGSKKDAAPPPPPPPPPDNEKCDPDNPDYQSQAMMKMLGGGGDECPCGTGECCYEMPDPILPMFTMKFCLDK